MLKATVQVNGVVIPAEVFENCLQGLMSHVESYYSKTYDADNIDALVEIRAEQLLKDHADNALEKLHALCNTLESVEDTIKPHWER